ncbi:MAG: methyltransferase domain-containing protein [Betaproteobacteria bacterium]|nr:methyltransferase domain-containing protein [Betaproteobacteria bacterium]
MANVDERWLLEGSAPKRYEQCKVPTLFRPLAERFIAYVGIQRGERLLDVACGTGIVARLAAPLTGRCGRVVGVDLNAQMLAVAKSCEPLDGMDIEWRQADAGELPFGSCSFDTVLCQQALQFFPDRARSLFEMRRVLRPDGKLAINVWAARNPYLRALARALRGHVSDESAQRCLSPLALCDGVALRSLVYTAGFRQVTLHIATIFRHMRDLRETLFGEIQDLPFACDIDQAGERARIGMAESMSAELRPYRTTSGYLIPADVYFS